MSNLGDLTTTAGLFVSGAQVCIGCGIITAVEFPFVAVMQPRDVPAGVPVSPAGPTGFVAAPCCDACHRDPAHRVRPIKGHFFTAADAAAAVFHAGRNAIGRP